MEAKSCSNCRFKRQTKEYPTFRLLCDRKSFPAAPFTSLMDIVICDPTGFYCGAWEMDNRTFAKGVAERVEKQPNVIDDCAEAVDKVTKPN